MAEGPQALATAKRLDAALGGKRVTLIEAFAGRLKNSTLLNKLQGRICRSVRTHGKNIFIEFDEAVINTHLLMYGRWRVYGSREKFTRKNARLVLHTKRHTAVLYGAPLMRVLTPEEMTSDQKINSLGPDAMAKPYQREWIIENFRKSENMHREIGQALLDQTVVAGIGNIYKSEILFQARVNPLYRTEEVGLSEIERVIEQIPETLWFAYHNEFRTVTPNHGESDFYVYFRAGKPCLICGSSILSKKQEGRITFWCPSCQKDP